MWVVLKFFSHTLFCPKLKMPYRQVPLGCLTFISSKLLFSGGQLLPNWLPLKANKVNWEPLISWFFTIFCVNLNSCTLDGIEDWGIQKCSEKISVLVSMQFWGQFWRLEVRCHPKVISFRSFSYMKTSWTQIWPKIENSERGSDLPPWPHSVLCSPRQ